MRDVEKLGMPFTQQQASGPYRCRPIDLGFGASPLTPPPLFLLLFPSRDPLAFQGTWGLSRLEELVALGWVP